MALVPLNLLVTHDGKSKRQHVTCRYKCGDACSKPVPNTSDNEYFGDIVKAVSRRSMLQAGGVAVLAVGAGSALAACGADEQPSRDTHLVDAAPAETPPGMKFTAVAPNSEDVVVIADGYEQGVVISWGDPVLPERAEVRRRQADRRRPAWPVRLQQRLRRAAARSPGQQNRFLLVTNFEYVTPQFMFPGYNADAPTREQFDIEIAAIGMGVVEVERTPEGLKPVMGRYNRRITADTPMTLTGPAAGTDFVKTAADPTGRTIAGTFANCAGGVTPWGTVLSGEENFHEYFGAAEGAPPPRPVDADRQDRYGVALEPSALLWETFDPALRPRQDAQRGRTGSATSSSSTRGIRTRRRSSTPRWGGSSTRAPTSTSPTTAPSWSTPATTNASTTCTSSSRARRCSRAQDPGGDGAQHDAARRGHALRRQAVQRHPRQRDRRLGQAAGEGLVQPAPEPGSRCCGPARTGRPSRWSTG